MFFGSKISSMDLKEQFTSFFEKIMVRNLYIDLYLKGKIVSSLNDFAIFKISDLKSYDIRLIIDKDFFKDCDSFLAKFTNLDYFGAFDTPKDIRNVKSALLPNDPVYRRALSQVKRKLILTYEGRELITFPFEKFPNLKTLHLDMYPNLKKFGFSSSSNRVVLNGNFKNLFIPKPHVYVQLSQNTCENLEMLIVSRHQPINYEWLKKLKSLTLHDITPSELNVFLKENLPKLSQVVELGVHFKSFQQTSSTNDLKSMTKQITSVKMSWFNEVTGTELKDLEHILELVPTVKELELTLNWDHSSKNIKYLEKIISLDITLEKLRMNCDQLEQKNFNGILNQMMEKGKIEEIILESNSTRIHAKRLSNRSSIR